MIASGSADRCDTAEQSFDHKFEIFGAELMFSEQLALEKY
jgi:hypothetical protein